MKRALKTLSLAMVLTFIFCIYGIAQERTESVSDLFYPTGYDGDIRDIYFTDSWTVNPHTGDTCIRITYTGGKSQGLGWAGVYWLYPENNWGDKPEGRNLTGAKTLNFWARGEDGGERMNFKVGGITAGRYPESFEPVSKEFTLTREWQRYEIPLGNRDLSHVIAGFYCGSSIDQNAYGCVVFLDDIKFVK